MIGKEKLNIEIGDLKINDAAEKIGSLISERGRKIGEIIDNFTKDVTIKILTLIEKF